MMEEGCWTTLCIVFAGGYILCCCWAALNSCKCGNLFEEPGRQTSCLCRAVEVTVWHCWAASGQAGTFAWLHTRLLWWGRDGGELERLPPDPDRPLVWKWLVCSQDEDLSTMFWQGTTISVVSWHHSLLDNSWKHLAFGIFLGVQHFQESL